MTDEVREEPVEDRSGQDMGLIDDGTEESAAPRRSPLNMILIMLAVVLVVAVGGVGYYVYQLATVPQAPRTFADVQIQELQGRIKSSPRETQLYLQLAASYYQIKEYDKALQALDDARSNGATGSPLAESIYATARIQETRGNEDAAINGYLRSLQVTDTADARYALGQIHLKRKDWAAAIDDFTHYTANQPNDITGYKQLAAAYEGKGDKANALKQYERAVSYVPNDAEALAAIKRLKGQ